MRKRLPRTAGLLGLLLAGLAVISPAAPASAAAVPAAPAFRCGNRPDRRPGGCGQPTAAALASYFDQATPGQLSTNHVPGAAVSVVAGGQLVFSHGYGLADVAAGTPMDPARSLVRVASITKLFTWTAIMQQVQAGRLDLNVDVNRYLTAFKVPATYPEPITLLDLMDHTAGFEDRVVATAARTAGDVTPLEQYLADHMPARIRPPGIVSAYSNYGAGLAGYILAKVSGQPYDQYIEQQLMAPLGMTHSTATEPVPAALAADLARSYDSDADPVRPIPFTFDPDLPDGSVSATADDLANFMIAQLDQGRFGSTSILDPATMAVLHTPSFAADPRLAGYAHGLETRLRNGYRLLMHGGSWEGFESLLVLIPGCDLGLFLTTNATGGVAAATQLVDGFFDRFVPPAAQPTTGPVAPANGRATVAPARPGFYQPARHNESTVEKLTTLLGSAPAERRPGRHGALQGHGLAAQPGGLYQSADGRPPGLPDRRRRPALRGHRRPHLPTARPGQHAAGQSGAAGRFRGGRGQRPGGAGGRADPPVAAPAERAPPGAGGWPAGWPSARPGSAWSSWSGCSRCCSATPATSSTACR